MTKPILVYFAPDGRLAGDLADALEATHQLVPIEDLAGLPSTAAVLEPAVVLIDVSNVSDGGHTAARVLDSTAERSPDSTIVVFVPATCPEPLERVAVERRVTLLADPTFATLAMHLGATTVEEADEPVESSSLREGDARDDTRTVLAGITRQFETNTLKLKRMLGEVEVAARHDVTILLIGETGSGKTFLSKLIHEVSPRRDEPFLHVACGALPSELIESELFGHVKGAFTSASDDKEGKFVAAGRGTVLLDEIDVLAPEQQVKLLRVIETGEFEPVGSNRTLRNQARLVVASNLDLQPLVEQGRFRPDLYYRLNMLKFEVTPLRERQPDIEPLVRKFVEELSVKHGVRITRIEDEVFESLLTYPWPGNVRELENVIRRAVIYCTDGILRAEHLPPHVLAGEAGPTNDPTVRLSSGGRPASQSLGAQVAVTEKEIIEQALFKNEYSKTKTAKALGISRVTLYNKLKKYGMQE